MADFEESELEAFNNLYEKLQKANAERLLILYFNSKPYAFSIIELEISQRTEFGRKLLDRIKEIGLI